MEYVYTAMLLHSAGTEVNAKSVEKVLKAAGVKAEKSRAEALVASLEGVDIEAPHPIPQKWLGRVQL